MAVERRSTNPPPVKSNNMCFVLQYRFIKTWRGCGWMERPHPLQLHPLSLRLVSNQLLHRACTDQYQVRNTNIPPICKSYPLATFMRFTITVAWQQQDTPAVLTPADLPCPSIQRGPNQVESPPPPHTHTHHSNIYLL